MDCCNLLAIFVETRHSHVLKPRVTNDFATRVGHAFPVKYSTKLEASTYTSLLDLAQETSHALAHLNPINNIDINSFIWVVCTYDVETDEATAELMLLLNSLTRHFTWGHEKSCRHLTRLPPCQPRRDNQCSRHLADDKGATPVNAASKLVVQDGHFPPVR